MELADGAGMFSYGGTYDPYGIACYWVGSFFAFGLHKFTSRNATLEDKV